MLSWLLFKTTKQKQNKTKQKQKQNKTNKQTKKKHDNLDATNAYPYNLTQAQEARR